MLLRLKTPTSQFASRKDPRLAALSMSLSATCGVRLFMRPTNPFILTLLFLLTILIVAMFEPLQLATMVVMQWIGLPIVFFLLVVNVFAISQLAQWVFCMIYCNIKKLFE